MDSVTTLYEEFRLIERREDEVNGAWKGAHLLLFFLTFIFGSFCTFCFHMLMFMFDEKCVLFPKLLSLASMKSKVVYDFIPENMKDFEGENVDFVNAQWVDQSECYLPTFVPLTSGIFGLVWTTMFLMCSTGSRTQTGLQRPWRVVPPVFVFSLAMSGLCIYSSVVTQYGLRQLCVKLGEITGTSSCSYTVNVATLLYERRIRGVYQATWLTIISAWVHTICWILSALLALLRILLAVDFQLVRVSANLLGDLDKILENREKQIRTVSPNSMLNNENSLDVSSSNLGGSVSTNIHFQNDVYKDETDDLSCLSVLYFADEPTRSPTNSKLSLVPEERHKLVRLEAYQTVPKNKKFIVKLLYDLLDDIEYPSNSDENSLDVSSSTVTLARSPEIRGIARQYGQEVILPNELFSSNRENINVREAEKIAKAIRRTLHERLYRQLSEIPIGISSDEANQSTSKKRGHIAFESTMNITEEMKRNIEDKLKKNLIDSSYGLSKRKKSNLKNRITAQKKKEHETGKPNVNISDSKKGIHISSSSESLKSTNEKETQTRPKEKQD